MNTKAIMSSAKSLLNKAMFEIQKHSPKILVGAGIIGAATSTILACKSTIKAKDVLEDLSRTKEVIRDCREDEELIESGEYTEEDAKKDTAIAYVQTGVSLLKLYLPSAALFAVSILCVVASHNILNERNLALAAAYTTIDTSFKKYRSRVTERFGKAVDNEMLYGIQKKKVDDIVTDPETGKEKKVKREAYVTNPSDISGYARFFERYTTDEEGNTITNPNWQNDNELNLMFIKAQEKYANDLLRSRKRLFLNEVYKMLGLPQTKAGQIVGWVYDPDDPDRDNYVDFGLYLDNLSYSDFVNGFDNAILLDFNVDGNIWKLMS